MKKTISLLALVILSCGGIFGCAKDTRTSFENLPMTQQTQIQEEVKAKFFSGYLETTATMLAKPGLSDRQQTKIIDSNIKILQSNVKRYLKTHYPDINFGSWIEKMK